MKKLAITFIGLLIGLISFSQKSFTNPTITGLPIKGLIKGIVKDNTTKNVVEYANIAVYSAKDSTMITGALTNVEGVFEIQNLPEGKYYVTADFIGFHKKIISNIEINSDMKIADVGTIILEEAAQNISEVEVSADKNQVQFKIDKKVVNVSKNLTAVGGTVANALENTPSIQVDSEGNVTLRGSSDFTVLIDGKPTSLKGADALKQIPASAVENVEIVTNPSAKYDPDGTSGIINIIMKKEYKTGMNGIVNISGGTNYKHAGDFTLNYRTDKINYFASANYSNRPEAQKMYLDNEKFYSDTLHLVNSESKRDQLIDSYSFKGGADFYLNKQNTVSASGEYGYWGYNLNMFTKSTEITNPEISTTYNTSDAKLKIGGDYYSGNLNYTHNFTKKGHELSSVLLFTHWNGKTISDVDAQKTTENWLSTINSNRNKSNQNVINDTYRLKVDYSLPITETYKIEAGYQSNFEASSSVFTNSQFNENIWTIEPFYDNTFDFSQDIHSVYSTFSGALSGFNYQLGIRGEYAERSLNLTKENVKYNYNKFEYFPTLHISKDLTAQQQLQFSYSRRINRPEDRDLNPNPIYSDSYVYQSGNPDLLPELTDSYELNYMKQFKIGFASIQTYYRQTNNAISMTMNLGNDGRTEIKSGNLGKDFSYGAEISSNLTLAKWFSIYTNASLYSYNISGGVISETADNQSTNVDFSTNLTFTIDPLTKIQTTAFYQAPKVTAQGKMGEMYGMNAAISRDFFKRKLSASLRINDIFNTMNFTMKSESQNIKTNFKFDGESQSFMLSLSYKINNYNKRHEETLDKNFGGGI